MENKFIIVGAGNKSGEIQAKLRKVGVEAEIFLPEVEVNFKHGLRMLEKKAITNLIVISATEFPESVEEELELINYDKRLTGKMLIKNDRIFPGDFMKPKKAKK